MSKIENLTKKLAIAEKNVERYTKMKDSASVQYWLHIVKTTKHEIGRVYKNER